MLWSMPATVVTGPAILAMRSTWYVADCVNCDNLPLYMFMFMCMHVVGVYHPLHVHIHVHVPVAGTVYMYMF